MKFPVAPLALVAGLSAVPAYAQDFRVIGGATLTSNYISDGVTQTQNDPALQPFVEIDANGIYGGLWASNVKFDDSRDRYEFELYAGYRGETMGGLAYDFGYERSFYNRTGDAGGEFFGSLEAKMADGVSLATEAAYDPISRDLTSAIGLGFTTMEGIKLSSQIGRSQSDSANFWNVGVGYDFNDAMGVDLRYHDTSQTDGALALSGTVEFDLFR